VGDRDTPGSVKCRLMLHGTLPMTVADEAWGRYSYDPSWSSITDDCDERMQRKQD